MHNKVLLNKKVTANVCKPFATLNRIFLNYLIKLKTKKMTDQKDAILKALTAKHIETINTDKLNTVNGGVVICIVVIDLPS